MKALKSISLICLSILFIVSPSAKAYFILSQAGKYFKSKNNFVAKIEIKEEFLPGSSKITELPNVSLFELLGLASLAPGQKLLEAQQYEAAIQSWEKELLKYRQKNYKFSESLTLSTISSVYIISGDYDNSINYAQQALVIAKQLKNPLLESLACVSLGATYTAFGEYEVANQYSQSALSVAQSLKKSYPKHLLSDMFLVVEGTALVNLAMTFGFDAKDYDKAISYSKQALTITEKTKDLFTRGTALNVLGGAYYGKKNHELAIKYFEEGLISARKSLDKRREGYILNYMGLALWKAQKLEAAEKTLREGMAAWESVRAAYRSDRNKVSVLDVHAKTYRSLQQVLIARNKPEEALEIAERGRSRALVEILAKRSANISVNDTSIAPPNIQAIQSIAKMHNATLVEYSIIYQESEVEEVKPSTKEAQLLIWVVKPTGEILLRQVDLASQLKSLKQSVRELLDERSDSLFSNIGTPQSKLQHLHKLLIQPIANLLPSDPTAPVIFIPQDVLYRVPFVALQDERGKYLIEQHTVLSAPSIQVLDLTYQQYKRLHRQGNDTLAVGSSRPKIIVGNPTGANLKAAEKSAIAIASILGTQALIGQDATKSRVLARLSDATVIHLATHGKYVDDKGAGLQSSLAFAPAGQDQGLLTASEIFDLKLSANLVVLSACNSGRGEITGEGVIGLSRAFIAAGVPSLVLSLWSIKDEDSAGFMQQFYQNLNQGQDKAQALRQAMLYMVQQDKPVRDWAAFTLIGESEP